MKRGEVRVNSGDLVVERFVRRFFNSERTFAKFGEPVGKFLAARKFFFVKVFRIGVERALDGLEVGRDITRRGAVGGGDRLTRLNNHIGDEALEIRFVSIRRGIVYWIDAPAKRKRLGVRLSVGGTVPDDERVQRPSAATPQRQTPGPSIENESNAGNALVIHTIPRSKSTPSKPRRDSAGSRPTALSSSKVSGAVLSCEPNPSFKERDGPAE